MNVWLPYREGLRDMLAERVEWRHALLRWRAFVEQTHRDRYTLEYLTRSVWRSRYQRADVEFWLRIEDELAERC